VDTVSQNEGKQRKATHQRDDDDAEDDGDVANSKLLMLRSMLGVVQQVPSQMPNLRHLHQRSRGFASRSEFSSIRLDKTGQRG